MPRKPSYQSAAKELISLTKNRTKLGISGKAEVKIPLPSGPVSKPKLTPEILEKIGRR